MKLREHVLLVVMMVFIMAVGLLLFFDDVVAFVGSLLVLPVLNGLLGLGKHIAGRLDGLAGQGSQPLFLAGNLVMALLVLKSVSFHRFTTGKPRMTHLLIASATFLAGLALLVVQGGFSLGFPEHAISEDLKGVSKLLMGGEGLVISYAPFYFVWKARPRPPPVIRNEDVG